MKIASAGCILKRTKFYSPRNLDLPIGTKVLEVLVPEQEYFALSGEQGQLIQSLLAQLRDLDAGDLSAQVWGHIFGNGVRPKKVGLLGVSAASGIGELCKPLLAIMVKQGL